MIVSLTPIFFMSLPYVVKPNYGGNGIALSRVFRTVVLLFEWKGITLSSLASRNPQKSDLVRGGTS